jgi:hypothetical protein
MKAYQLVRRKYRNYNALNRIGIKIFEKFVVMHSLIMNAMYIQKVH